MPQYAIRVRFHTDEVSAVAHDQKTLDVPIPAANKTAVVKALNVDAIKDANRLSLQVRGFEDDAAAKAFGERMKDAIRICGVQLRTGLDVGNDRARGHLYQHGKEWARQMFGLSADVPIHSDVHGLFVYEDTDPEPRFADLGAGVKIGRNKDNFVAALQQGFELAERISDSQSLSAEMYNMSHFESSARARFVTLVTTVECISQPVGLSAAIQQLVDSLKAVAQESEVMSKLPKDDPLRNSFLGRLNDLKNESIAKACARVVEGRLDRPARMEFQKWYDVRSKIVHTGMVPTGIDIASEVMRLDEMVSKLLLADIRATHAS